MALNGYVQGMYAPLNMCGVSLSLVKVVAPTVNALQLDPLGSQGFAVLSAVAGAYTLDTPSTIGGAVLGISPINLGVQSIQNFHFGAFGGGLNFTLSGGANLSGNQEVHIALIHFGHGS